jgi:hypothetical protein
MGFIAEFRLTSPTMRQTTRALPSTSLEMEDLQLLEGQLPRYYFWASGGDLDELEQQLERDGTIEDFAFLTEVRDRRLYRVTFTEDVRERLAYPDAAELDMVYLRVVQQNGRSHIRAQVVSRDALRNYRDCCERRGLTFVLERLYQEDSDDDTLRYGLTERQREALVLAHRRGYFGATRETDLQAIADELDISRQALADRLRRGHEHLIANTLR